MAAVNLVIQACEASLTGEGFGGLTGLKFNKCEVEYTKVLDQKPGTIYHPFIITYYYHYLSFI